MLGSNNSGMDRLKESVFNIGEVLIFQAQVD